MGCTTILVGKKASYDGSTMIARNDDGFFDVKKLVKVLPKDIKKEYKSVISHLKIELPDNPIGYTCTPSVDLKNGIWGAHGINDLNVAMTATETITTNALVLGADPYVIYKKAENGKKEVLGGLGEEDFVSIILPYIKSARDGVYRFKELLEKYGTYESNGIAFSDENEIWLLETIGGHHFIAKRVKDDEYVMMPNQFGLDNFDFEDAYSEKKENICSDDLLEFVNKNHLNLGRDDEPFNPRLAFGSSRDSDHVYNTPRAWYMGRYFNPNSFKWEGEDADFTPTSNDIPWSLIPEKKITIEDVKYILSSYFQGTKYNPYGEDKEAGKYRSIGINRTGSMAILQIRGYMKDELKAVEWICFGSNTYNQVIPVYTRSNTIPKYLSKVELIPSTENFYWQSRLIGSLADPYHNICIQTIERYQNGLLYKDFELLYKYDKEFENGNVTLEIANEEISKEAKEITDKAIKNLVFESSMQMKNGYKRKDN